MSFKLGEHGVMVEMFAPCPKCKVRYMIQYEDGAELCTYCGYKKGPSVVWDEERGKYQSSQQRTKQNEATNSLSS